MKKVAKQINLSVSSVNLESRVLGAASIISIGEAKGHEFKGLPVYADATTLKQVADLINSANEKCYVNRDHSSDLGSKIGRILNAKVIGSCVVSSLKFLDVAFTDACKRIGDYIFSVAESDSDIIGCSLEMICNFEVLNERAYIRPTEVQGVSIVNDPAFETRLAMYNNKTTINTKDKEIKMTEEVKKEEVKPVEAAEPVAPEVPKEEPKVEAPVAEEPKAEDPAEETAEEVTISDLSVKIDGIMEALTQIASLMPQLADMKATAEKAVVEAEKKAEVALSAKEDAEKKLKLAQEHEDVIVTAEKEPAFDFERCKRDSAYYKAHKQEFISACRQSR